MTALPALIKTKQNLISQALPRHLKFERFVQMAMAEYGRNKDIAQCDPMTVLGSIVKASSLGLEISNDLGHCYLVAFNNRKTGVKECQLIPGYKGLMDLARRGENGCEVTAREVYEHDTFEYEYGLNERLVHRPATGARGNLTHVYAVATFKNGTKKFEVMTIDDIERVKNTSRSKNFGPWVDHYEAMAKKSVIRKLAKFLPLSPEFAQVQALDNDEPQENWRIVEPDYVPEKTVEPTLLAEANKEADAEKVLELKKRVLAVLEKLEAKFPNDWMERLKVTGAPDIDKMTEPELTKLGVLCASLLK